MEEEEDKRYELTLLPPLLRSHVAPDCLRLFR